MCFVSLLKTCIDVIWNGRQGCWEWEERPRQSHHLTNSANQPQYMWLSWLAQLAIFLSGGYFTPSSVQGWLLVLGFYWWVWGTRWDAVDWNQIGYVLGKYSNPLH